MAKLRTNVPIRELRKLFPPEYVAQHSIDTLSKPKLLEEIYQDSKIVEQFGKLEKNYQFIIPPTLYLVCNPRVNSLIEISQKSKEVYQNSGGLLDLNEESRIKQVFSIQEAFFTDESKKFLEIPLCYTKKVPLILGEPKDKFGEEEIYITLENSFIWLPADYKHGIIACSDFAALKPIIKWGIKNLDLRWFPPTLSEEMLIKIAANGILRSATFTYNSQVPHKGHDVQTITLYDPELEQKSDFTHIRTDVERSQTFGFYYRHPDLSYGGLGISRRYGKIWTPAHVAKATLLNLSVGIITKTEQELSNQLDADILKFTSYFGKIKIQIGSNEINNELKSTFIEFLAPIIRKSQHKEIQSNVSDELLFKLVKSQEKLFLSFTLEYECPNCGTDIYLCPECGTPVIPYAENTSKIVFKCPNHLDHQIINDELTCRCGEIITISASNNILGFPQTEIINAIQETCKSMPDVNFADGFIIKGNLIELVKYKKKPNLKTYTLSDLISWQMGPRIHLRANPSTSKKKRIIKVLNNVKEKCSPLTSKPSKALCDECFNKSFEKSLITKQTMCLPRMFGYVIGKEFDGVHHGHEYADIKYSDSLADDHSRVRIGIHLKSRLDYKRPSLGRTTYPIKSLYTQLFYSAYQVLNNKIAKFDILGISIPNHINPDIRESMNDMMSRLGISFLIADEDDWLKIVDTIYESF
jgi:hypothetical protein